MKTSPHVLLLPLACICCLLVPCIGLAEGAVRRLECTVQTTCDARGRCAAAAGEISFRLEPIRISEGGAGSYRIVYGDRSADMQAQSELGPYYWTIDSRRHALIISSESQWLWHELETSPSPVATIRFLTCSLQG